MDQLIWKSREQFEDIKSELKTKLLIQVQVNIISFTLDYLEQA